MVVFAKWDGFKHRCEALTLDKQYTLGLVAESTKLREMVAEHDKTDAAARTTRNGYVKKGATTADKGLFFLWCSPQRRRQRRHSWSMLRLSLRRMPGRGVFRFKPVHCLLLGVGRMMKKYIVFMLGDENRTTSSIRCAIGNAKPFRAVKQAMLLTLNTFLKIGAKTCRGMD